MMPLDELLPDGPTCQHGYWLGMCPACAALEELATAMARIEELEDRLADFDHDLLAKIDADAAGSTDCYTWMNSKVAEVERLRATLRDIADSGGRAGDRRQYDDAECLRRYGEDGGCDHCSTPGREIGMICPRAEALIALNGGKGGK